MEVRPNNIYTIKYSRHYHGWQNWQHQWSLMGLSGDLTAGILAAYRTIIQLYHVFHANELAKHRLKIRDTTGDSIEISLDRPQFNIILGDYAIPAGDKVRLRTTYIWSMIADNQAGLINYAFRSPEFVQGFISTCNAFGVDFRDYVVGLPFKYDPITGARIEYNIQGYGPLPPA